jgi:hypothetical protein
MIFCFQAADHTPADYATIDTFKCFDDLKIKLSLLDRWPSCFIDFFKGDLHFIRVVSFTGC